MRFRGKHVLVTGAAGFIGSHLVQRLLAEGAQVRAMVHYRSDPALHNLDFLSLEERAALDIRRGAIEDGRFMHAVVDGCDVVFHLAALIGIPYSYVAPQSYLNTNVLGTLNVLEACRSAATPRLIHTSTSETYGTAIYKPIDEKHPLQAQSPYSATKIAADKLVESYHRSFGVPVVTVRPFNTYGPRQSQRAVIPTIISQLLRPGATLKLGDVTPVRDLTYVTDTVEGFLCAALAGPEALGVAINLGTGVAVSVQELAILIMTRMGVSRPIATEEARVRPKNSEVFALLSDNRRAVQLLGWQPATCLEDGLVLTVEFFRTHGNMPPEARYSI